MHKQNEFPVTAIILASSRFYEFQIPNFINWIIRTQYVTVHFKWTHGANVFRSFALKQRAQKMTALLFKHNAQWHLQTQQQEINYTDNVLCIQNCNVFAIVWQLNQLDLDSPDISIVFFKVLLFEKISFFIIALVSSWRWNQIEIISLSSCSNCFFPPHFLSLFVMFRSIVTTYNDCVAYSPHI